MTGGKAVAAAVTTGRDQIIAAVGTEPPVGGHRAAARLAGRTGLAVEKTDVEALADAGLLAVAGWYKQWPLWDCRALDAVDAGALGAVVAGRQAWIAGSISTWDAPAYLGWRREEFTRIARQRGLQTGRLDRYARAGLDALAGDEDLAEQVRLDRLLMTCQAAQHLEIRETDLRYLLAGDLIVPKTHTAVQVSRYRWVDVPLYRTGDLEALREHPDIDWEAVRAVRPGEPSPLRHLARRPADRAAVIRRGIAELGDRYGAEVWAWWNNNAGIWEADFGRLDGGPTVSEFKAAIAGHPRLREHREAIAVATEAGAAIRWARAMREPGAAVILDTETTGLAGTSWRSPSSTRPPARCCWTRWSTRAARSSRAPAGCTASPTGSWPARRRWPGCCPGCLRSPPAGPCWHTTPGSTTTRWSGMPAVMAWTRPTSPTSAAGRA